MSESLNLEIYQGGELLANAYYNWSGYTRSALELTEAILDIMPTICESNPVLKAIRLLESTNAGLAPEEKTYGGQHLEGFNPNQFKDAIDKNEGLISISEDGMVDTQQSGSHRVAIVLDNQFIEFGVCLIHDQEECCEEWFESKEEARKRYEAMPIYSRDISEFNFNEFGEIKTLIDEVVDTGHCDYRLPTGEVISFIE